MLLSLLVAHSLCHAKPTPAVKRNTVAFAVVALNTPRPEELESQIFLAPGVQSCLRDSLKKKPMLSLEIAGELNRQGALAETKITHASKALTVCLGRELEKIKLTEGAAGPFRIQISRVEKGSTKGKTILLDMKEPKKFQ